MKYKLCIVADVPNWSFDSIAKKIQKELSYKYDIRIAYFNRRTEQDNFYEFIEENSDCDLIHFLNRRMLLLIDTPVFKNKVEQSGRNFEQYVLENKQKFTTSVYDYMDCGEDAIEEYKKIYNEYTKKYYTATPKLYEIYSSIKEFKKPDDMIFDICDEDLFVPINLERFNPENINNRPIVIGWVGNSVHNDEKEVDLKGFNTIIKPLVSELKKQGYNIDGYFADRNENWKTQEEMPSYYANIDIYVCASIHEGTPRPVLEAMLCGVPIISTNVGIVDAAFGNKQKAYIIGDRENGKNDKNIKENLKNKILYLYENRFVLKELSEENMKSINEFDGGKTIKAFESFFESCL